MCGFSTGSLFFSMSQVHFIGRLLHQKVLSRFVPGLHHTEWLLRNRRTCPWKGCPYLYYPCFCCECQDINLAFLIEISHFLRLAGWSSSLLPSNSGTGYDIYNLSGKKIIAYGDSITSNGQYLGYAEKKIGVTIKNAGISSTTMTPSSNPKSNGDLLTSFNGTCPDLSKYDIVTIAHGTNDLSSSVPIGEIGLITDKILDTNTFYGAYRKVIETIIKNYPHIRIVLCTPIHKYTTYEANEAVANSAGHTLKDYVDALVERCEANHIPVFDMYRKGGINKYNYQYYLTDGIHPKSKTGYEYMASKIFAFFRETFSKEKDPA